MKRSYFPVFLLFFLVFLSFSISYFLGRSSWFFRALRRLGVVFISEEPEIAIHCERSEIYVGESNNCTVIGCREGWLEVTNLEESPLNLSRPMLVRINVSGRLIFTHEFGPAVEGGKVMVRVVCNDPDLEVNKTIKVIKGPYLDCPESCPLREDCTCTVNDCLEGLFLLRNYDGKPLMNNVIEEVKGKFNFTFRAFRRGRVEARMRCTKPFFSHGTSYISIGMPSLRFGMSSISCNETHCSLSIDRNTMEERVKIMVQLLEEPYGVIYSTGSTEVDPGFEGEEIIPLKKLRECREGKELKILVIASVDDRRIDRLKDEYSC